MPVHCRMRAFDRDLIRGGHYGQRSNETAPTGRTHGCTDQRRDVKILLANSGPSTHGTFETSTDVRCQVRFRGQTGKHLLSLSFTGFDPTLDIGSPGFGPNHLWRIEPDRPCAPPYFGAGARIAASAFSRASIFACMAVSCARSAPTLKNTSFSTGASSLAA